MSVSARAPLLAGLALLAACPAPVPTLPAGEIVNAIAIDGEHALVLIQSADESATSALVGADGKLTWAVDVGEDSIPVHALHRVDLGDRLLLIGGESSRLVQRADGRELARVAHIPPAARAQAGEHLSYSSTEFKDGASISILSGDTTVVTALDPLAASELWRLERPDRTHLELLNTPGWLALDLFEGRPWASAGESTREPGLGLVGTRESRLELIDARRGTLLASVPQVGHCEAGASIFAVTREDRLVAFDLGGDLSTPRTVLDHLSLPAPSSGGWHLGSCARDASTLVLSLVDAHEIVLTVAVDLASGQQREQHGLCDLGSPRPIHGRWMPMRLGGRVQGFALLDVFAGTFAWEQDPKIHAADYHRTFVVDDILYLTSLPDPGARQVQHLLAIDLASGDITGAAAIVGGYHVDAASFAGGHPWLFAARMNRGPTAPFVRLDPRTLKPGTALPPGLDIIDVTTEARAAQRPVREREPGRYWDPQEPTTAPALRCSAHDP